MSGCFSFVLLLFQTNVVPTFQIYKGTETRVVAVTAGGSGDGGQCAPRQPTGKLSLKFTSMLTSLIS